MDSTDTLSHKYCFLQGAVICMAQCVTPLNAFLGSVDTHNCVKIKSSGLFEEFPVSGKNQLASIRSWRTPLSDFFWKHRSKLLNWDKMMIPADLSGLRFLKWYYLPLPRILQELKDMTRELKINHLRMLIVAFSITDLQLPAMAAVIPKNCSLSQGVPVLHIYKVNKSPSCRTVPALSVAWGVQINMMEL